MKLCCSFNEAGAVESSGQCLSEYACYLFGCERIEVHGCFRADFADGLDVRCQNDTAMCHGLERRQPKALIDTGENQSDSVPV